MKRKFLVVFLLFVLSAAVAFLIWLRFDISKLRFATKDLTLKEVVENSTVKVIERRKSWTKPASPELIAEYLPLWEKLFKEKNNLSDSYFKKHIKVVYTSTATDEDRQLSSPGIRGKESFFVDAVYNFDWLSFIVGGELTIKEAGSDELLSVSQIKEKEYYWIIPLKEVTKLPYSFSEVLAALKKVNPKVINLTLRDFSSYSSKGVKKKYWFQPELPAEGINLNAFGTIDEKANECASLTIDILTLKGASSEAFCWIR